MTSSDPQEIMEKLRRKHHVFPLSIVLPDGLALVLDAEVYAGTMMAKIVSRTDTALTDQELILIPF